MRATLGTERLFVPAQSSYHSLALSCCARHARKVIELTGSSRVRHQWARPNGVMPRHPRWDPHGTSIIGGISHLEQGNALRDRSQKGVSKPYRARRLHRRTSLDASVSQHAAFAPFCVRTSTYSSVAAGAPLAIGKNPGISVSEARVLKLQAKLVYADTAHKKRASSRRGISMTRALITVVLAGVLVAAGAVPSMAQIATPTFDDLGAEGHWGEIVYVTDQGGTKVKGRVVRISSTAIDLLVNEGSRAWAASDVARITQRHRHAGRGALVGLAVGAIGGILVVLTDPVCQNNPHATWGCGPDDALFLAALCGGIGAGAGAAIGAAIRTERVLYAAPSPPSAHVVELGVAPGGIGLRAQLRF